jgi:YaiO family outer membrane protein
MKRRAGLLPILLLLLLGGVFSKLGPTSQQDPREKAAAAIRARDYESAIKLCLAGLEQNPADYEFNFQLARAYAQTGRLDKAQEILAELSRAHPENTDVLLLRARIDAWEKNYASAEKGYQAVLTLDDGNPEAETGLAELASWQGDPAKAISLYDQVLGREPGNADIHYRVGRLYLRQGNFALAEKSMREAHRLDPENEEYRLGLRQAKPGLQQKFELRYEHQTDGFSDGRSPYVEENLALQARLSGNMGPLVLKYSRAKRFGRDDYRFGLEHYPTLWKRAYGYVDLSYAPRADLYPSWSALLEVYQGLLAAAEISLGYRRQQFNALAASQLLGSMGYYLGNYYACFRWYVSGREAGDRFSWILNLRRYFTQTSYIFAGVGQGARSKEILTLDDWRAKARSILQAGFNWYFFDRLRLQLVFVSGAEGPLHRNTLYLCTGYRW